MLPSSVSFSSKLSGCNRGRKSPSVSVAFKRTFSLLFSNVASTKGKARAANSRKKSFRGSSGFSLLENGLTLRGLWECWGEDTKLRVRRTCEITPRILQHSGSRVCGCSRRARAHPTMSVQEDSTSNTCHVSFSTSSTKISIWNRRKVGFWDQHVSRIRSRIQVVEQFTTGPLVPVCALPSSPSQPLAILSKIAPTRVVNTSSWFLSCFVWDTGERHQTAIFH